MPVAFFRFHRQQSFQVPNGAALFLDRLLREPDEVRPDDRHAQRPAILPHTGVFQRLCRLVHRVTSTPLLVTPSNKSYSCISGRGRSYRSSPLPSHGSGCERTSSFAVTRCRTAAASVQPSARASSTACFSRSQP